VAEVTVRAYISFCYPLLPLLEMVEQENKNRVYHTEDLNWLDLKLTQPHGWVICNLLRETTQFLVHFRHANHMPILRTVLEEIREIYGDRL
jgi:hypothetical protein